MKKYFKGPMISPVVEQIHWVPVAANTPLPVDHGYDLPTSSNRFVDPNGEMSKDREQCDCAFKSEKFELEIKSEPDEEPPNQLSPNISEDVFQNNSGQTMSIHEARNETEVASKKVEYIFCRDYQNKTCKKPKCKYVHASIFEQERYHESGVLPPEALSHLNRPNTNTRTLCHNAPAVVSVPEILQAEPNNIRVTPPPPPPDFRTLPSSHQYELPMIINTATERQIIATEENVRTDNQAESYKIKIRSELQKLISNPSKPDVCRDYLRNKCSRINCYFRHPKEEERVAEIIKEICDYKFCRDFQNTKTCSHVDCKYVHASKVEEAIYHLTGVLPVGTVGHIYKKNTNTGTIVVGEPETFIVVPNVATMPATQQGIQTQNSMPIELPNLNIPPPPIHQIRLGQALQLKFSELN